MTQGARGRPTANECRSWVSNPSLLSHSAALCSVWERVCSAVSCRSVAGVGLLSPRKGEWAPVADRLGKGERPPLSQERPHLPVLSPGTFSAPWAALAHSREQYCLAWEATYLMELGNALETILSGLANMVAQEALKYTVLSGKPPLTPTSSIPTTPKPHWFCTFACLRPPVSQAQCWSPRTQRDKVYGPYREETDKQPITLSHSVSVSNCCITNNPITQ